MSPLISVVIPTRNNEKTITAAIESIQNQTIENIEIIIVDDNSRFGIIE
jgi:glycosyltransferase involved in cell wall biosynthesis